MTLIQNKIQEEEQTNRVSQGNAFECRSCQKVFTLNEVVVVLII